MFAVHFLMRHFAREALRLLQRLLRFEGQFFRLHNGANLTQRRQDAKTRNFNHGWTRMNQRGLRRNRQFWTAAGSEAPRRFWKPPVSTESGVAAALCHRSPNLYREGRAVY